MPKPRRKPEETPTRDRLIEAAGEAFNAVGFHGTDTNRIAKAAGFAPQTFYRHFTDKLDVFLAVYDAWESSQAAAVRRAARAADPAVAIADAVVAHHRAWSGFRRSLRLLAVEDARVGKARADGRRRQLASLRKVRGGDAPDSVLLADLLCVERLADAIADGEWREFEVTAAAARREVVTAVRRARAGSNP